MNLRVKILISFFTFIIIIVSSILFTKHENFNDYKSMVELVIKTKRTKASIDDYKFFENNAVYKSQKPILCDWCYYKPICPEFNPDSPNTDELEECNNTINEINETIEAVNMVGGLENLPENSPLKNTDLEEINKKLDELENKRNRIVKEIGDFLRK